MDPTIKTTQILSRRSTKEEILGAIRESTKLGLKEYKLTGMVGNTRPDNLDHAFEICQGLSVMSARSNAGNIVPTFEWNTDRGPKVIWDKKKIPYHFLSDSKDIEEAKRKTEASPWSIDREEVLADIVTEVDESINSQSCLRCHAEGGSEDVETLSAREKVMLGIAQRNEIRGTSQPESLQAKRDSGITEKSDPDEWTAADKIKIGLQG